MENKELYFKCVKEIMDTASTNMALNCYNRDGKFWVDLLQDENVKGQKTIFKKFFSKNCNMDFKGIHTNKNSSGTHISLCFINKSRSESNYGREYYLKIHNICFEILKDKE